MATTLDDTDFGLVRGDTWSRIFHLINIDPDTGVETDQDLTGTTWKMHLRTFVEAATIAVAATFDLTDVLNGKVTATLDAADTALLDPEITYPYDVEVTYTDATVETVLTGSFQIEGDVSR